MPTQFLQENNTAIYYKFKIGDVYKSPRLTVKQPAIFRYDKTSQEKDKHVFESEYIGGYLASMDIWEPKETSYGLLKICSLELHSFQNNKLTREVLEMNMDSSVFEKVVSKLASATDYSWITIKGTNYKSTDGSYKPTVTVAQTKDIKYLKARVNFRYKDSQYPQPENLIEIPPIQYALDEDGLPLQENGRHIVSPKWKKKKEDLFVTVFKQIQDNLKQWQQENPFNLKMQPSQVIAQENPIKDNSANDSIPEIDLDPDIPSGVISEDNIDNLPF